MVDLERQRKTNSTFEVWLGSPQGAQGTKTRINFNDYCVLNGEKILCRWDQKGKDSNSQEGTEGLVPMKTERSVSEQKDN